MQKYVLICTTLSFHSKLWINENRSRSATPAPIQSRTIRDGNAGNGFEGRGRICSSMEETLSTRAKILEISNFLGDIMSSPFSSLRPM